jgi:hypothetical protein
MISIMANMKISCNHIRHKSQLNHANLGLIMRAYYKNNDIEIEVIGNENDLTTIGEHYMSDISKITVKLKNSNFPIRMIVKEPIQSFTQKLYSKLLRPFMRETFWYTEVVPIFKSSHHEIESISAQCFHATSTYQDDYG